MDNYQNSGKKSNISLIVLVVGVLLIIGGVVFFLLNSGSDNKNSATNNTTEEPTQQPKTLRKILPEEMDNAAAKEIIQFKYDTEKKEENWNVESAYLYATDDETGFVVNFVAKNETGTWYRQTILTYENGTWTMEFPVWAEGEKDISAYPSYYGIEEDVE